jgi:hypothetical protein
VHHEINQHNQEIRNDLQIEYKGEREAYQSAGEERLGLLAAAPSHQTCEAALLDPA